MRCAYLKLLKKKKEKIQREDGGCGFFKEVSQ